MVLLAIHNHLAFGAFWRTGYAVSHEQTGFGWGYFAEHWMPYLEGLAGPGVGLLFGLGVVGLAALCARPETRQHGVLLAALILPTTLLYMAYYWQPSTMSLRFLLPTYYLYAIAGVWFLSLIAEKIGRPAVIGAGVLVGLSLVWGVSRSLENLAMQRTRNASLARVTEAVEEHVPAGSILLVDRQVGQHLDVIGQWQLGQAEVLAGGDRRRRGFGMSRLFGLGRPGADGPVPGAGPRGDPFAQGAEVGAKAAGPDDAQRWQDGPNPMAGGAMQRLDKYRNLSEPERSAMVRQDLVAWAGDETSIYVVGVKEEIVARMQRLGLDDGLEELATIELPEPEPRLRRTARGAGKAGPGLAGFGRPARAGPGGAMGPFGGRRTNRPLAIIEVQL